ncbi:Fc receptor-like protein 4 isoform X3 [Zonotrichia albicollis]|uniref:Fc receptor-like protein 4 isoform X3 n=1 Tax=Zonotrichia albicollis TaxID=44394 RepID=UPI003D8116F8
MAGDTGMAGMLALLLWAQTLGFAGAQTTQLLVDPPWRPAKLWDQVTLTCQGSGTAGATTWYQDGQHWWQEGPANFTVTASGIYRCDRPGIGLSLPMRVLNARLVLQVPAWELLEGDTMTMRCRCWQDMSVTEVRFYHEDKEVGRSLTGTKLSLSPLQLNHSGRYRCGGQVDSKVAPWMLSAPVTVTVHELFLVPVLEGPSEPTEGSPLTLSCLSTPSPLWPRAPLLHVFYQDRQVVGSPQGSLQLLVPAVGVSHSGNCSCQVCSEGGGSAEKQHLAPCHCTHARGHCHHHTPCPGADTARHRDTEEHSGCRGQWGHFVPPPACGYHCGLVPVAPPGCQEAPGKGPPRPHGTPSGGSSGDVHGAAKAAMGTQRHL